MDPSIVGRAHTKSPGGRIMSSRESLEYDGFQFSSEDEEGSVSEGYEDGPGSQEELVEGPQHVRPQKLSVERSQKKAKTNQASREIVDELQTVQLVKAYREEFAAFGRGKKQTPKQMIPKKVWGKIYHDHFVRMFPNSGFEQDTLKRHLREQLAELYRGVADDGQRPVLQDEVIASEVRATDCYATRNILRLGRGFVDGVTPVGPFAAGHSPSPAASGPSLGAHASGAHVPSRLALSPSAPAAMFTAPRTPAPAAGGGPQTQPPTQHATSSSNDSPRPTKADMLHKQADAVCSIAKNFQDVSEKQGLLMDAKRAKYQLVLLKEAKEYGLIDENEFKERLKKLLQF